MRKNTGVTAPWPKPETILLQAELGVSRVLLKEKSEHLLKDSAGSMFRLKYILGYLYLCQLSCVNVHLNTKLKM
jgi:hypothetical protein